MTDRRTVSKLGTYKVGDLLGSGGMASVYKGYDTVNKRDVAIKVLSINEQTADFVKRFKREVKVVKSLRHPNIVEIIDWDVLPDGGPCMIMELLRGETLNRRIKNAGPLPWDFIAQIGDQIAKLNAKAKTVADGGTAITDALTSIEGQSTATTTVAEQQTAAVKEISASAQQAAEGSSQTSEGVNDIAQTVKSAAEEARGVAGVADEVAGLAEDLKTRIGEFLAGVKAA